MNILELSGDLIDALHQLHEAYEDLQYIRKLEEEFRDYGAPQSPHDADCQHIIDTFRRAADEATHAALPTAFDASKFAVSLDELRNCATRDAALAKIQGYLDALQEAQERGQSGLATLDAKVTAADDALRCLNDVLDLYAKLSHLPEFGNTFAWAWLDVDQFIRPAILAWRKAVVTQRNALVAELDKVKLYIPNLSANLAALRQLRCSIEGTWHGSFTMMGQTVNGVRVDFARAGAGYVGGVVATVDGETESATLSDIRLDAARNIHFAIEDFETVCDGSVSADFRQMSGTIRETEDGAAGTFSLSFG